MRHWQRIQLGFRLIVLVIVFGAPGVAAAAPGDYETNHGSYLRAADREPPLFGLTARHISGVRLSGTAPGTDSRFDVTTLETGRDWSFAVASDGAGMVGFRFGLRDYHGNGLNDTFYSLGFGVGLTWFATANLRLSAAFRPGLYTDFAGSLSGRDWQYLGEIMATYRMSAEFFLYGGLGITNDFYDLPVVPMAGFSWVPSEVFRLDVMAPKSVAVTWRPAPVVGFHTGVFLEGTKYNWHRAAGETRFFVQDVRAEVGMRLYLMRNLSASLVGGGIVAGEYRIAGDRAQQDDSWFLSLGLGFTF